MLPKAEVQPFKYNERLLLTRLYLCRLRRVRGRIKGLQFSVFKGGPGWYEYIPGTENQIKCPLFLTEQISHTQMQTDVIKTG